jgi:hypothetical protein
MRMVKIAVSFVLKSVKELTKLAHFIYDNLGYRRILGAVVAIGCISDYLYHRSALTSELLRKKERCKLEFERNNCEPGLRLEAAEEFCEQQQKCLD